MKLYKKLKSISAVRFHEVKFTGNLNLLDMDYEEEKEYTPQNIIDINKAWSDMYDEYFERTDDPRFRKVLKNKNKTLELSLKIVNIQRIAEILEKIEKDKRYFDEATFYETIKTFGEQINAVEKRIKFDYLQPIPSQLTRINSVLGGLQSRYKILFKDDVKAQELDLMAFYSAKASIEGILDRNLDESVNMLQWIAYEKQSKKKVEQLKSQK